jgi:hypothetical protein
MIYLFVALCFIIILYFLYKRKTYNNKLPPLSPTSLFININKTGYERLNNFHAQSKWCETQSQNIESGTVFRMRMPFWNPFIVCCDYKLARLILSGSSDERIKEFEKSYQIQNLNLFPNVCSLLT